MKSKASIKIISLEIIVAILAILLVVIGFIMFNKDSLNSTEITNDVELSIIDEELGEPYNGVLTKTFKFCDSSSNAVNLVNGNINLGKVIEAVNKYLSESTYPVRELGVSRDTLYIVQDTNSVADGKMKLNFLSISDNIDTQTWIEALELVHSENEILAGSIISYSTDTGSRHYMYIYYADEADDAVETPEAGTDTDSNTVTENDSSGVETTDQ